MSLPVVELQAQNIRNIKHSFILPQFFRNCTGEAASKRKPVVKNVQESFSIGGDLDINCVQSEVHSSQTVF